MSTWKGGGKNTQDQSWEANVRILMEREWKKGRN